MNYEQQGNVPVVKTRLTPAHAKKLDTVTIVAYLDIIRDFYGKWNDANNGLLTHQKYGSLTGAEVMKLFDKMRPVAGRYRYVMEVLTKELARRFKDQTGVSHSAIDFDGLLQSFVKDYPQLTRDMDVIKQEWEQKEQERMLAEQAENKGEMEIVKEVQD